MKPSESQFRASVIALAEWTGHRCYHVVDVRKQLRNHTARGFPDLVISRPGRLLIAELKVGKNRRTPDQHAWADCLPAENYRLWRPGNWSEIEELLMRKRP